MQHLNGSSQGVLSRVDLEAELVAMIGEASALVAAIDGVETFSRDSMPNERQFDGLRYLANKLHERARRLEIELLDSSPAGQVATALSKTGGDG
jgi:hypothetical protein